jgi:hypothetical protein
VTARMAIAIIRATMTVNLVVITTSVTIIKKVAVTVTTINLLGSDLLERPSY